MKHTLPLLALLLLAGCSRAPQTVAEWEANHPHAKIVHVFPSVDGSLEVREYFDRVPNITHTGSYSVTPTTYAFTVVDGMVGNGVQRYTFDEAGNVLP